MSDRKQCRDVTQSKETALFLKNMALLEDEYFARIAGERIAKGGRYISSGEFWKNVL